MIEDKDAYYAKRDEILDKQNELLGRLDVVRSMLAEYGDITLGELKERMKADLLALEDEFQDHTKEEFETLAKINKEFVASQLDSLVANGSDSIDLVNAYLRGDLDRYKEKP